MYPRLTLRGVATYAFHLVAQSRLGLDSLGNHEGQQQEAALAGGSSVPYIRLSGAPYCPIDGPTSCRNSTPADDACCFLHPGGRMLLTQFWDYETHAGGGEEDWTLHGLWPDHCDGSFDAFCSLAPRFTNITDVLLQYGQDELLEFMERYWIANRGSNAHLWAHEYNKHATCVNTLATDCYGEGYRPGVEVVDYFVRATSLFGFLNTYTALSQVGIRPSPTRRYPLADVQHALEQLSGGRVVLRCSGPRHDTLHEVWYVYFVQGSLQTGQFMPAGNLGREGNAGNCVPWVRYLPKTARGPRPVHAGK